MSARLLSFYLLPCYLVFLVANLFKTILTVVVATVVGTISPVLQVGKSRPRKEHGGALVHAQLCGSKFRTFPTILLCLLVGFKIQFSNVTLASNLANRYSSS